MGVKKILKNKMNQKKNIKPISIESDKTSRRRFLSNLWKILGLVAFAELVFFTIGMLRPGRKNMKDNSVPNFKIAGNVDDFTVNSVTPDRVNKYYLVRMEDLGQHKKSVSLPVPFICIRQTRDSYKFSCSPTVRLFSGSH
jgi:hypothetical protein